MQKLLLLSIVISTFALPVLSARDPSAARGVKKTLVLMAVFDLFYMVAIRLVYARL
jgi:hypothetical protein